MAVRFALDFDRDALRRALRVVLEAKPSLPLPMPAQPATRLLYPVKIERRLGLIRTKTDEAALPEGYEALLVPRMTACIRWTWSRTAS